MKYGSLKTMNPLRMVARIMSAIIVVFALIMFIGESMESVNRLSNEPLTRYSILQLLLFSIGLLGLAIAWKWELTGGLVSLIAFVTLFIVNTAAFVPLMLIFPANAILFIIVKYQRIESKLKSI